MNRDQDHSEGKPKFIRKKILVLSLAIILIFPVILSPAVAAQDTSDRLKALIVTGQNYHNWKATSAALKRILEQTGLFAVDIAVSPPAKAEMKNFRPNFSAYKLVVLDYSGDAWPRAAQKAFVEFVKKGGGVVVFHSADNSFPDWPEYNEIIGLAGWGNRTEKAGPYVFWKDGQTIRDAQPGLAGYHTPPHPFLIVTRDSTHPIMTGLPEKWMHAEDELYSMLRGPARNLTVLATAYCAPKEAGTGRHEPVLFAVNYGAGRVFHTVLGHAVGDGPHPAIECVGFIVTFQRGAEWAATAKVTQEIPADFPVTTMDISTPEDVRRWPGYRPPSLEAILQELESFVYSKNEEVLSRLRDYILTHRNTAAARASCEERLLGFLVLSKNLDAKLAVCRQLRLIGSEKSVPLLEKMLLQDETTDMTRYALEKIPGREADQALLNGLARMPGAAKIGIISTLGMRKSSVALQELAPLLTGQESDVASATAVALGRIGNAEAAGILLQAYDEAQAEIKDEIASALLSCGETFRASKNLVAAAQIYEKILSAPQTLPLVIRQTALRRKILTFEKSQATKLVFEILSAGPPDLHEPAISLVPSLFDPASIGSVYALLPKLPEKSQVQFISVLADYPRQAVLPTVLGAAKSPLPDPRITALRSLGKVGDASVVSFLADRSSSTKGEEQLAARQSLWTLPGKEVDEAILFSLLSSPHEAVKNELARAVAERRIEAGKRLLLDQPWAVSERNRLEAIRALRQLATPADLPSLLNLLLRLEDEAAQEEAANAVAAAARQIPDPLSRTDAVEKMLAPPRGLAAEKKTDPAKRCLLYKALGKIGDDSSLPLVRAALINENAKIVDAGVRAMTEWPTAAARHDVLDLARNSANLTHKVLALRAYIRMIGQEPYQAPENAVSRLREALDLASRPEEKRLVLAALPVFACPQALRLAESLLSEEGVKEEAEKAVEKISEKLNPKK
ncbi:MAG: ThuA domain-containing protein [Acidobacteriota bacterium]